MSDRPGFLDEPPKPLAEPAAIPPRGWLQGAVGAEGPVTHDAAPLLPGPPVAGAAPLTLAILAGLALILGVAALELTNFTLAQFDRAPALGWLTLGLLGPAAAVLLWSLWREWRGLIGLARVERTRRGLAGERIDTVRAHARLWLDAIGATPEERRTILAAPDAATLRALLRAGPLARLDNATVEAGRTAAMQTFATAAVSPWPGLDGVIVVWRGLRLVREIARLHGLRPGTLGTLRLFRRVVLDAGAVVATDMVATAIADTIDKSPLGRIVAHAAGATVAGQRMLRLALAVSASCKPI